MSSCLGSCSWSVCDYHSIPDNTPTDMQSKAYLFTLFSVLHTHLNQSVENESKHDVILSTDDIQ
ncbi:hypothetical protein L249_5467 [Ophiocordyceps polyrhachis-furcata BCC 54312]|uniref:Uncharacterized protein n=1 Tax=Ophiocordyceps polyrhachis-furcata BCC 54312 TaxID=1330021 RepID=A0A367LGT1_9HYPO|nr:hypothetical protein L249_5467 [Ophiocordyceps polyrhachis-furcata BCC 54312]